ncbi:MAG: DUF3883 domain-containing protein [Nitrososphaerota archaeon]|nr:DUF3883 domain-containing protein [Nitrososphaerota archaeon]
MSEPEKVILAKTAWMTAYLGPLKGDRPRGKYRWIDKEGHLGAEAYNFKPSPETGKCHGYIAGRRGMNLARIDTSERGSRLGNVTIVWISKPPTGGELRVVGWYRNATLLGSLDEDSGPWTDPEYAEAEWTDGTCPFICSVPRQRAILLPEEDRAAWVLPVAIRRIMKRTSVLYPLSDDGTGTQSRWVGQLQGVLGRIKRFPAGGYASPTERESEEAASALRGQGFKVNPGDRKAVELKAMELAIAYYRRAPRRFDVQDVHERLPYDLECKKGRRTIIVEVKGTTGDGSTVLLTPKEFHLKPPNGCTRALFIVPDIKLRRGKAVSAGKPRIIQPFNPIGYPHSPIGYEIDLDD